MKRLYAAILFLAIAISLCVFEQYTVKTAYNEASGYINTAIESLENDDYNTVKSACKDLNNFWGEKQKYMTAMIDHGSLDEASITIGSLEELAENESDNLEDELITAKNQLKSIYDNQKITFGNIF